MKPYDDLTDTRVVKALAHPLRVRVLDILEDRIASPSDIAEELDASLGVISYHVRRLAELQLVELVRKTPRRGAVEHYYRARPRRHMSDHAWADVPEVVKREMAAAALGEISAKVNAAAVEGAFAAPDTHLSITEVSLDARGWKELAGELARLLRRIDELGAESARRRGAEAGGARPSTLVLMAFETTRAAGNAARTRAGNGGRAPAAGTRTRRPRGTARS
jgi:DNA-binding transcriptional ArsR family regulator